MYHPVTTEYGIISQNIKNVLSAVRNSGYPYVIIYPNNDFGAEIIINEYKKMENDKKYRIFSSIRFEYFLTLLKYASFMIGNSSAGIRETGVYGIPAIDIGSRQYGRYDVKISKNIQHVAEKEEDILEAVRHIDNYRHVSSIFGSGNSAERFMEI